MNRTIRPQDQKEASPEAKAYIAQLYREMYERIARGEEEECTVTVYPHDPATETPERDFSSFSL